MEEIKEGQIGLGCTDCAVSFVEAVRRGLRVEGFIIHHLRLCSRHFSVAVEYWF